jgi:hypothetical protein
VSRKGKHTGQEQMRSEMMGEKHYCNIHHQVLCKGGSTNYLMIQLLLLTLVPCHIDFLKKKKMSEPIEDLGLGLYILELFTSIISFISMGTNEHFIELIK